jgi:hypothetical protein
MIYIGTFQIRDFKLSLVIISGQARSAQGFRGTLLIKTFPPKPAYPEGGWRAAMRSIAWGSSGGGCLSGIKQVLGDIKLENAKNTVKWIRQMGFAWLYGRSHCRTDAFYNRVLIRSAKPVRF